MHRYKVKGCIVELYQFHCTNESLSLRLLSGHAEMPLHAERDRPLSRADQPATDRPHGYVCGSAKAGVWGTDGNGRGRVLRDDPGEGDLRAAHPEGTVS